MNINPNINNFHLILAKSNGVSLLEHTKHVLEGVEILSSKIPNNLILGNELVRVKDILRLAAVLHDLGKVYPIFQWKILKNEQYLQNYDSIKEMFNKNGLKVRHNVISLFFIDKEKISSIYPICSEQAFYSILMSSVVCHHWREIEKRYFLNINEDLKNLAKLFLKYMKDNNITVGDFLADILKQNMSFAIDLQGHNVKVSDLISFDTHMARKIIEGGNLLDLGIIPPYSMYLLPIKLKMETFLQINHVSWIYVVGFLIRSDHFASWEEIQSDLDGQIRVSIDIEPISSLSTILSQEYQSNLWQIKKIIERNCKDSNVILIAPTGVGKTEFSLLWADGSKFFYVLPFRVAVNQMYDRIERYIYKDNTRTSENLLGILHSDADFYIIDKYSKLNLEQEIEELEGEMYQILELSKSFCMPYMICTGDQVFPAALGYPQYEKVYSTLGYSKLIIDEVQAYDPRACAIILKLIEDTMQLGSKFIIVTATLPGFIKQRINSIDPEIKIINLYDELFDNNNSLVRHKCKLSEILNIDDLGNVSEKIVEIASRGNRVLAVFNTVKKAEIIYGKIQEIIKDKKLDTNIVYCGLIHSRFSLNERKRKEEEISKQFCNPKPFDEKIGKILVSTQVIETSLDIDADYLFTEIAPMDSLIQRMGRVLRRVMKIKVEHNDRLVVYIPTEIPTTDKANVFIYYSKEEGKVCEIRGESTGIRFSSSSRIYDKSVIQKTFEILDSRKNSQGIIEMSERIKQELVERTYENIDSSYINKFDQTISILRSGYMSDSKREAQRLFREIYTSPIVYRKHVEDIKNRIMDKIYKIHQDMQESRRIWNWFKQNIVADFVIQDYLGRYKNPRSLKDVLAEIFSDIQGLNQETEKHLRKIINYCHGIYVVDQEQEEDFFII